ncbi:hypothetical protein GDO86_004030 [Hymenochirus boettgeri]|uniref:Hcy-binding domain-containing protein n=1 Tax=Hymenochirus boettgeri TaxID=247094 RepID=A0A8T2K7B9_9PIPI|nr:hypothetical protein GDO86_004030 [Hymenochirus boettgeri]
MVEVVKIMSGGLSTELETAGLTLQGDPLWSARLLHTNPQAIKEVHRSFLRSGAEVLTTATYQATIKGFQQHAGLNVEDAEECLHIGVRLAKEAADEFNWKSLDKRNILIAGSIGPYGAFLSNGSEYSGYYVKEMSTEDLKDWHRVQMQCLASAGIDFFALETIPSKKEAEALLEVLREFPNTKAWLSYSCQSTTSTSYGDPFEEAVKLAHKSHQIVAVGANCCSPFLISPLLTCANKNRKQENGWIVYPNSGEKWDQESGWHTCNNAEMFCVHAEEWVNLGATWIGGCCRTSPSAIANLRKILRPFSGNIK